MRGQGDVLQHRQAIEWTRDLVGARQALPANAVGRPSGTGLTTQQHRALGRLVMAGDHVDEGRLARTVGAEQAQNLAAVQIKVHPIQGADTGKLLAQATHFQHFLAVGGIGRACQRSLQHQIVWLAMHGFNMPSSGLTLVLDQALVLTQLPGAQNATRHDQHSPRQHQANDDLADQRTLTGGEGVEQKRDQDAAQHGAGPVAAAAQHAHEHYGQGHGDVEGLAHRDIRHVQSMDGAHDPSKETRQRKSAHLEPEGGHAVDLGGIFVVMDGQQTQTGAGMEQPPGHGDAQDRQDQTGVIKGGRRLGAPLRQVDAHQVDPRATIDGRVDHHRGQHKAHRQGDQGERFTTDFAHIEHQRPDGQSQQRREQSTAQRSRHHGPVGFGGQRGHAVHADTEKRPMTEREIARVAREHVPGGGQCHPEEDHVQQGLQVHRQAQVRRGKQQRQHHEQDGNSLDLIHHHA